MIGRKVLIVHAAGVMRMIVREMLTAGGFDVVGEADSGGQAIEKYRALLPDVVTMDMVLPDMDGIAAVKAILAEFPEALIIMCTSMDEKALVVQVMQAGAKGFVTKPFRPLKLVEAIEKLYRQAAC